MRALCGLCLLSSVLAFGFVRAQEKGKAAPPPAPKKLTMEELAKLLENPGNIFFLDVREPEEIKQLGSVKGYVNIPISQLEARLNEVPKDKVIVTL